MQSLSKQKAPSQTPQRIFNNWLKAYVDYTSASESPLQFRFWAGVGAIAGALRRQVWIDQVYFQWTPNFYIFLVAPPGVAAKSTSIGVARRLLAQVPGIHFGPSSLTWQALTQSLSDAHELVQISETEFLPMSCITCFVSELGTFFRPQDDDLINVLIDMWDAPIGVWERATKTQGSTKIENPWLNIIGCTTPAWLKRNLDEDAIKGGLLSRVVFVYADKKEKLIAYPKEHIKDNREIEEALVHDLSIIASLTGEYALTDAAKKWGEQWYEEHWTSRPKDMSGERFDGYLARKQTHIHKLAMVLQAARSSELVIDKDVLVEANQIMTAQEKDIQRVFSAIGLSDTAKFVNDIMDIVRAFGAIAYKDLYRRAINLMTAKDFKETMEAALEVGALKLIMRGKVAYVTMGKEEKRERGEER